MSKTRKSTLYRLTNPGEEVYSLDQYVRPRYRSDSNFKLANFTIGEFNGLLATGGYPKDRADWCDIAQQITGIPVEERSHAAAGLLLIRAESGTYAITYGLGQHLLDPYYRDDQFGLLFATRCLDDDGIVKVRNQLMDGRGRIDEYSVASGDHIDGFGLERFSAVVRRICGLVSNVDLSSLSGTRKSVRVECSESAIKLPLATKPDELLADIRAIEAVCAQPNPLPGLKFIDRLRPLDSHNQKAIRARSTLESMLTNPNDPGLSVSVPDSCQEGYGTTQKVRLSLGGQVIEADEVNLFDLLKLTQGESEENRLEALGQVRVSLFSDDDLKTPSSTSTRGKDWLAAEVVSESDRFFYGNGRWYTAGDGFLETLEEEIEEILAKDSGLSLPSWPKGTIVNKKDSHDEDWYNRMAAKTTGFDLFDKQTIVTNRFRGGGIEACDLLGPDNELICVKKASSTAPLSHLFMQGVTAVETLRIDQEVREKFLHQVETKTPNHRLLSDFGSLKVVFAILLKGGEPITSKTLFAFAQVVLINAARRLRQMNAAVEVVAINR